MSSRAEPVARNASAKPVDAVPLAEFLAQQASKPEPASPGAARAQAPGVVPEIGGRKDGLDPTRYGDWEKGGRCIDF
jgi:hypothetical protein